MLSIQRSSSKFDGSTGNISRISGAISMQIRKGQHKSSGYRLVNVASSCISAVTAFVATECRGLAFAEPPRRPWTKIPAFTHKSVLNTLSSLLYYYEYLYYAKLLVFVCQYQDVNFYANLPNDG